MTIWNNTEYIVDKKGVFDKSVVIVIEGREGEKMTQREEIERGVSVK